MVTMLCAMSQGQRTIGRVALRDAAVTGTLEVSEGQAMLMGGASIVAKDHTAELMLERGGMVEVCATSSLHVTSGATVGEVTPLLFALDRGAMEVRTVMGSHDVLITPDLRFSTLNGGNVDLRVRVTMNGDTCVENRGMGAPTIEVVEQFGDGRYLVPAAQHVLFEHGSIREVVDRETSPCGCPPAPVMSLAESGITAAPGDAARAGSQAAQKVEEHPFPAAVSQGLAETGAAKVPQAVPGQVHAQVAATMAYGGVADSTSAGAKTGQTAPPAAVAGQGAAGGAKAAGSADGRASRAPAAGSADGAASRAAAKPDAPVAVEAPAAPAPPGAKDLAHRVGRFFKRIFGGH